MTDIFVTMHKIVRIPGDPDKMFAGGKFLITVAEKIERNSSLDCHHNVVIITDLSYKYATSVTNGIESIATHLLSVGIGNQPAQSPNKYFPFNFVEHYEDKDHYHLVEVESHAMHINGVDTSTTPCYRIITDVTSWDLLETRGEDPCEVAPRILEEILELRLVGALSGECT